MIKIDNLNIEFDSFSLKNISITVKKGEYFMLLGASGAGKSVILECIAGLIKQKNGQIFLNNVDISREPIGKRKVGIVFQEAALFPHFTVKDNIAFPLKNRKIKKNEIERKVILSATEMNVKHLLNRYPETLSGGEKQRVALARTLAAEPDILLLDEPLSAIDIGLRAEIRTLLRRLNQKGQTIIHVTHDYEEAISLASQIAIINNGEIIQTGTPKYVFTHPKNKFVAQFGGIKNFYKAKLQHKASGQIVNAVINNKISFKILTGQTADSGFVLIGQKNIFVSKNQPDSKTLNKFQGVIKEIIPAKFGYELVIDCGISFYVAITAETLQEHNYNEEQKVWISFNPSVVKFIAG